MAFLSFVASTPIGAVPTSSPASLPTFSGRLHSTPTTSNAGLWAKWRSATDPTLPIPHWMTRYFFSGSGFPVTTAPLLGREHGLSPHQAADDFGLRDVLDGDQSLG